jgi:hypothetical protein
MLTAHKTAVHLSACWAKKIVNRPPRFRDRCSGWDNDSLVWSSLVAAIREAEMTLCRSHSGHLLKRLRSVSPSMVQEGDCIATIEHLSKIDRSFSVRLREWTKKEQIYEDIDLALEAESEPY